VGGIEVHRWCQWKDRCPIVGVSGRIGAPSLVSVEGSVPHRWCQWEYSGKNSAPSLVSMGDIVSNGWCQWKAQCPIVGVIGRNRGPSLVSVVGSVPHR
ncbi:unnamed protein product, partial [Staurois parvus]